MNKKLRVKLGEPSWRLATREVEAFVTETGAHVGPVTFRLGDKKIRPFAVAPWAGQKTSPTLPPILKVLRGDFFCLPFGGNTTPYRGERHPIHGEAANNRWRCESLDAGRLHLSLSTRIRRGQVDKYVFLQPGHRAVYQRHIISGMSGPMSLGHHAMLKFPDHARSGRISTSRFVHGQVFPLPAENPAQRGYSCLKPGSLFRSLDRVRLQAGDNTDLTSYPARRGFEDIVMIVSDERQEFAWTAVVFPSEGYVWFALKDPRVLRNTVFWISNGGRHYAPWNGRHVNVLGLEEVTANFHLGLAESARANPLSATGRPTSLVLSPKFPLVVNYIMAIAPLPRGFDSVARINASPEGGSVELVSSNRMKIHVPLNIAFLHGDQTG